MTTDTTQLATGLTSEQVADRRRKFGDNSLPEPPRQGFLAKFLAQFRNPLIYILLFALVVDTGIWIYGDAEGKPVEAITILLILLANAILGLWQNLKSDAALSRLDKLTEPHCWVIRNSALQRIESRLLVPDDIVRVEAGERLPADGVVLQNSGLIVDESIVTGESAPVTVETNGAVLSGTLAVRGTALIRISSIGNDSTMGKLALMLAGVERDQTPLEKRLQRLGRRIAYAVSAIALILWLSGIILAGPGYTGELFLLVVALAVAAVPESLPAVITLTLALGVERMAKRKAIVRKLSAVEALGSVSVIATDKTGTLTENRMSVQQLDCSDEGAAHIAMVLVNDADLDSGAGDPLELGILTHIDQLDSNLIATIRDAHKPVSSRPFDAQWKFMRVTVSDSAGETKSYFKGAPEVLLNLSTLDTQEQSRWQERINAHASKGYRALALARSDGETEQNLEWLGLILLLDPPRAEVADAIRQALAAGIRIVMLTGDHPATGFEIARQVGIRSEGVLTGAELEALSPAEFDNALASTNVFARVSPELKYRIVKALQQRGETVAVTGDGVNDAPALKVADVGVAMGQRGSDVAREVADLVLVDDNFATIVAAIEEGRNIFENIQKFIRFLFAANLAEVLLIVIGSLITISAFSGTPDFILPLTAAQILWINLLTDSIPALAMAFDRNPGVLLHKPRLTSAAILDRNSVLFIITVGLVGSLFALATFFVLPLAGVERDVTQTVVFCYLAIVQLVIVNPSRRSNLKPESSVLVTIAILLSLLLQILIVSVPALRNLLGLAPLTWNLAAVILVLLALSWLLANGCSALLRRQRQNEVLQAQISH